MKLKDYLRGQGYDLIDGPVRNHKPLQLWVKKIFNGIDLYYESIDHAFTSTVSLTLQESEALEINATKRDDYSFNIGITVLEELLKSLGISQLELAGKVIAGKKVSISYDNAITRECAVGTIENYLSEADFRHNNPALLHNANRDNIVVISGGIFAKNLVVEIETTMKIDAELVAKLNQLGEGNLSFSSNGTSTLKMRSTGNHYFPIAVKANRLDFDKGKFVKLKLVTDNRNFF
jgi:hypothetical protein